MKRACELKSNTIESQNKIKNVCKGEGLGIETRLS